MAAPARLQSDPRWLDMVERYSFDLAGFAMDVIGMDLTWQQAEIADAISQPGCRVSVASGHGIGKTRLIGVIALWHLVCYYCSNTIITAPKIDQVRKQAWQEIADMRIKMEEGPFAWLAKHIVVKAETVWIRGMKEGWWIIGQTAPKGSPENLAGKHRDWLLWLADEASGIPDENFQVINGSLSDARNRLAMFSQPTRPSGYFYETHHGNNKINGGNFTAIVTNSEESPIVSPESIMRWRKEYGGRSSAMYGIKVRGLFPDKNDGMLLGKSEIQAAFERDPASVIDELRGEYGRILIADVGEGVYRDDSVLAEVLVSGSGEYCDQDARRIVVKDFPIISNARDPLTFAGDIYAHWLKMPDAVVYVDAGGAGASVCKVLEDKGVNLVRVRWGTPCFKDRNRKMFINQRAHCCYTAADAIKAGRVAIASDMKWRSKLETQGSRLPYYFDEKAIIHIESKEKMREDGIPSPDLFDVVCMAFLEGSYYTALSSGETQSIAAGSVTRAKREAEDAFSGVD